MRPYEELRPEQTTWALPGYFPRKYVSLVVGKRSGGKSMFVAWLAALLSRGEGIDENGAIVKMTTPLSVWWNSLEDPIGSTVRQRLEAAKADRVLVSNTDLLLPMDAGRLDDQMSEYHPDIVFLDSLQQHFQNPYLGYKANRLAMRQLARIAERHDSAIVLIHHLNKGKGSTVEAAIGGQGVIQNNAKAIYLFGHYPSPNGDSRALACERIGMAAIPPSLFLTLSDDGGTPHYDYQGRVEITSDDLYHASRIGTSGSGATDLQVAAEWALAFFQDRDYAPATKEEFDLAFNGEGLFKSRAQYNRARSRAGVVVLSEDDLRAYFSEDDYLLRVAGREASHWLAVPRPVEIEAGVPHSETETDG